jgi:type IV secretion system protein VirB4
VFNLYQAIKPWKESEALHSQLNLYGFWTDTTFLTKSGDLGMIAAVHGVDYESLDSAEQEYAVKRLQSAMKSFGKGFRVYQYLLKSNCPSIPFAVYDDELVNVAVEQRRKFFEEKAESLYQVDIFYVFMIEGTPSKHRLLASLGTLFREPRKGLEELKAQFASSQMTELLRSQIEADRHRLEQSVDNFIHHVKDVTAIELLDSKGQFHFLRALINYDRAPAKERPASTGNLDYQIADSNVEAERDHLRVGGQFVKVMTLKEAPSETGPLFLKDLLRVNANFFAVSEWTPLTPSEGRSEVNKKRKHFNMAKSGFISQVHDPTRTSPRDVLIDESKQADVEDLGNCLRHLGEGQVLGRFSLTIVTYAEDLASVNRVASTIAASFAALDGALQVETYNQLNALFAAVPGNYRRNFRNMFLLNTNYADLSFLFTIHPGETVNAQLGCEYLAVLETDNATPYFLNLHNGDVAHTLILGMTGSGKSFLCNFLLSNAQKYRPQTYIFDIGGSFHSLTQIFGGGYAEVGKDSGSVRINPFSLPNTKEDHQFLFAFLKVLIEGPEQRFPLDFKEERRLFEAIERMYVLSPEQRTLSTFCQIVGDLKERLQRWTGQEQFGFLFDNAADELEFAHFQTFNFDSLRDAPDLLEPLLFYVLHRASKRITDPSNLATFKLFLLDEAWLFIRNESIRDYVVQAQKTWRKHNAAMIMATQSIKDLEDSGMLSIVAESCPTKIFLANPDMKRDVYRDAFHLNDTELDLISELVPPGEMLIRKSRSSKKVRLNVDSVSYWIATNNARDNILKNTAFKANGISEGIKTLAETYPHLSNR